MAGVIQKILEIMARLPSSFPKQPNVSKKSVLLATSVGGLVALLITAIYMRRKRKQLPFTNTQELQDRNGNVTHLQAGKRRKRPKIRRSDLAMLNPSNQPHYRRHRKRDHSIMSEASTVSSVKSSTSRHSRMSHLPAPGTKEYYEAERFYRKGVDAFESAILQWEKASNVLGSEISDVSSTQSGRSSSLSLEIGHQQSHFHQSTDRNLFTRSRNSSTSRMRGSAEDHEVNNKDELVDVPDLGSGDQITLTGSQLNSSSASEIEQTLFLFMERAEKLQKSFEEVLYSDSDTESDTDITLTGYDDPALSDSDTASFVSAQEVWETRSLEDYPCSQQHLAIYESALESVDAGRVRCRTMRTDILECFSDVEFLAKLHCVRQALDLMLEDTTVRDWLVESGRVMIELLLKSANHTVLQFNDSFALLIDYVKQSESWFQIEDELKGRKVVSMTFYDIVLDFIIMDSFDDLDRPPSQLISVLGNRWLTNSIKETALSTAVWSVLKAKSRMLRYQDGFIAKFYAVSESISPVLAWGFLGTDERLKSNCETFKSEILSYIQGMFSFEQVRYTTKQQMADDILHLTRHKVQKMITCFEERTALA